MAMARMREFDFLVAGSGLAGTYAALVASQYGSVGIITQGRLEQSNSYNAQGGIAAVVEHDDSPLLHLHDTLEAGRGLCDTKAAEILAYEAPARIRELIEMGMQFDSANGSLSLGLEGGHHHRRILHAGGDATVEHLTSFVLEQVELKQNITILEEHTALELLISPGGCQGLRSWNTRQNQEELIYAQNTILALGGLCALYPRSTNPRSTLGDGVALAYNAGCRIYDAEFVQFHPTALYAPDGTAFLVSEAVRGEGAYLRNQQGERFMLGRYPQAELSPRDQVTLAINQEIGKQDHMPYVWLDLRHLDAAKVVQRFPHIQQHCLALGYDLTKQIPVAPAAHYMVGGVRTDLQGATNIPHLYACGEIACSGLMGANRLASNSLIECLVFGKRAVEHAHSTPQRVEKSFESCYTQEAARAERLDNVTSSVGQILAQGASIVRTASSIEAALKELAILKAALPHDTHEYYTHLMHNRIVVARCILEGALFRKESRGGHFRSDYPTEQETYHCHTVQQKGQQITTAPIE